MATMMTAAGGDYGVERIVTTKFELHRKVELRPSRSEGRYTGYGLSR